MDADFLLIHKMKNGDEEAIEVFVKKYYSTIRNYCRLHTYTDCDAEDITQATFEHFFRSFRSYHHLGKTANYLYVIARNLCRDSYKKKRDIVMEALPDKGENPIAVIENKIDIEESIKKLPEDLQEVVILHYFQDFYTIYSCFVSPLLPVYSFPYYYLQKSDKNNTVVFFPKGLTF